MAPSFHSEKSTSRSSRSATKSGADDFTIVERSFEHVAPRGAAFAEIVKVMQQADGYASSIAASVEEQSATVRDIAKNSAEASTGVTEVVDNIAGVAQAAREAERNAAATQSPARSLQDLATGLASLIKKVG